MKIVQLERTATLRQCNTKKVQHETIPKKIKRKKIATVHHEKSCNMKRI